MVNYEFVHCVSCGAVVHVMDPEAKEMLRAIAESVLERRR
jgi:hypothetical protein